MKTDCSHIAVFRLQSSNPAYKLLISVWSRITSCATCGTVPREVSGTWCGVARVFRPGMANLPTRGAKTGAVEARTLKVIAGGADVAWSMAFVVIERPCCGRPGSCSYRPGEIGFPDKHRPHHPSSFKTHSLDSLAYIQQELRILICKFQTFTPNHSLSPQSIMTGTSAPPTRRGALIVVEGLDRAGKSSQCEMLRDSLSRQGHVVKYIRFPGT